MPYRHPPDSFDGLCVPTSPHNSEYFENVEFYNFKDNYTDYLSPCSENRAIVTHPIASDAMASHYLKNV